MNYLIIRDEHGERRDELNTPIVTIGRDGNSTIILTDKQCSRNHCKIEWTGEFYKMVDMGSRNGTRVNEELVNTKNLVSWDRIRIGRAIIILADPSQADPREGPQAPPAAEPKPLAPDETHPSDSALARLRASRRSRANRRPGKDQERLILTLVITGAALFLLMVGLRVMFGAQDGRPSGYARYENLVSRAERDWRKDPEFWLDAMSTVPASMGNLYKRAQNLSSRIAALMTDIREAEKVLEEERFAEIQRLRSRMNTEPDTLRSLSLVFLECHPASARQPEVAAVLEEANRTIRERAETDPGSFRRRLSYLLQKRDMGGAARLLQNSLLRMDEASRKEADLLKAQEEIRKAAGQELDRIALESRKLSPEMAAARYDVLISQWGDGNLELLAPYCEQAMQAAAKWGE